MRKRLVVVLALASAFVGGIGTANAAPPSAPLDTVSATGESAVILTPFPVFPPPQFTGINISAQSGTAGQNPTGFASYTFGPFHQSGSVTCLRVTGPDRGAGTPGAPTTAVLNFVDQPPDFFAGDVITVQLVDKGGNGQDVMGISADTTGTRAPGDCPVQFTADPFASAPLTSGRAIVIDATPLPTSTDQCKNGGWRNFPGFTNQGDCVSFVATGGRNQPNGH
jgi:hypothetical protein